MCSPKYLINRCHLGLIYLKLKFVFRLEENISCDMGQNSTNFLGNFQLAHDKVNLLEVMVDLCQIVSSKIFVSSFVFSFEFGG